MTARARDSQRNVSVSLLVRRGLLLAMIAVVGAIFWYSLRGPALKSAAVADPIVLNRGNGHEPESLDPQRGRTDSEHTVLRDLYEGLTSLNGDGRPTAGAASAWTLSDDGKTYTFTLRSNLRWSNGDPVVAEDFVFALRRLVNPETASPYAQVVDAIESASDITAGRASPATLGVSAPDPTTVVIRLRAPAPYIPGVLAHPSTFPVHRPTLEAHGRDFTKPGIAITNGAFVLDNWTIGSHIILKRNTQYWNDALNRIDVVKFHHIADQAAELRRYRGDELDITYVVPAAQFEWVRENLPRELYIAPQLTTYYYGFNLRHPPFANNLPLRRALAMAIDRERLTKTVTGRGELPAYGWVPTGVDNYRSQEPEWAKWTMEQRIAEAKKLYAQAGYSRERPLRTEIRYNADESHTRVAVAVASMWKEYLGVETELVGEEFKVLLQNIDRGDVTQVFRSSWIGDYNDAYTFAQYLKSDFGINLPRYRNPDYDKLLEQAAGEVDIAKRQALLEEAERLMLADQPLIPLYFYVSKHLVKPWVRGWHTNVMNVTYSKDLAIVR